MNTTSPARRAEQERSARIILAAGLAPVLPLAAVIVWVLGYKHVLAYVVAVIAVVVSAAAQSLVYAQNMKRARQL